MSDKCAPGKKYTEGSCFTYKNLQAIAEEYNKHNQDKQIRISSYHNKKDLLRVLNDRFQEVDKCSNFDQICWASSKLVKNMKDQDVQYTFRPKGPAKQYGWLSTNDIEAVIKQYEYIHKDFKFLGAVPSDFDELPIYETTDLEFAELERTTPKLGLVINLDTHNQSGSHWVALYANLKTNSIYYFDSFKKTPQNRVRKFITRLLAYMAYKNQNTKLDVDNFMRRYKKADDYDVRYNKIQHQFKNSECGVYSMNFIIRLLEGETFDEIVNDITNDEAMNRIRGKYFRNYTGPTD